MISNHLLNVWNPCNYTIIIVKYPLANFTKLSAYKTISDNLHSFLCSSTAPEFTWCAMLLPFTLSSPLLTTLEKFPLAPIKFGVFERRKFAQANRISQASTGGVVLPHPIREKKYLMSLIALNWKFHLCVCLSLCWLTCKQLMNTYYFSNSVWIRLLAFMS